MQAEVEILPLAQAENMGVITYSPLGAGLLTGKYDAGKRPESGRLVENARYTERYGVESDLATADRFRAFAQESGIKPATLAVAWAMSHPAITAPITGTEPRTAGGLLGCFGLRDDRGTPERDFGPLANPGPSDRPD